MKQQEGKTVLKTCDNKWGCIVHKVISASAVKWDTRAFML